MEENGLRKSIDSKLLKEQENYAYGEEAQKHFLQALEHLQRARMISGIKLRVIDVTCLDAAINANEVFIKALGSWLHDENIKVESIKELVGDVVSTPVPRVELRVEPQKVEQRVAPPRAKLEEVPIREAPFLGDEEEQEPTVDERKEAEELARAKARAQSAEEALRRYKAPKVDQKKPLAKASEVKLPFGLQTEEESQDG